MSNSQSQFFNISLFYASDENFTRGEAFLYNTKDNKFFHEEDPNIIPPFGINDKIPQNYTHNNKKYTLQEALWIITYSPKTGILWGNIQHSEEKTLKDLKKNFYILNTLMPLDHSLIRGETKIQSPFQNIELVYKPESKNFKNIDENIIIAGRNTKIGSYDNKIPLMEIKHNKDTLTLTYKQKGSHFIQEIKYHDKKQTNALIIEISQKIINEENIPEHEKIQKILEVQSYDCDDFFIRVIEHHKALNALGESIKKLLSDNN